jgi:hypothetical protein
MRRWAIAATRASTRAREQAHETVGAPPAPEPVAQMSELDELREQGILTHEEVAAEKRKLLGA